MENYDLLCSFLTRKNKNQKSIQPIYWKGEYITDYQGHIDFFNERIEMIKKDLISVEGKSILDLGCNVGYESLELAKLGANVTCVDIENDFIEMIKFLAETHNIDINPIHSSFEKFKPNNKFNVILMHHIFPGSLINDLINYIDECIKISDVVYIDYSPELKWEPITIYNRKEAQKDSLQLVLDSLNKYNIEVIDTKFSIIIKLKGIK